MKTQKATPAPLYRFDDFQLDPRNHRLSRTDGTPVALSPRAFDTLLFMVQHHGTVLDKERLMEAVWPDSIVEENNLTQHVSALRRVFGDTPESHRFIATVPGRGYRFVPEVRTAEEMEKLAPFAAPPEERAATSVPAKQLPGKKRGRGPVLLAASAIILLAAAGLFYWQRAGSNRLAPVNLSAGEKSIAVLPFENLSRDPDNAYFADGIKDEILTRLAKIAALKVISRTSTQKFKSSPENVREIARQLGVANILEGSVQKSGETVRVTVQLINTQTDTHLWAETYDRKLTDMFQVESEIAQRIASALETTLSSTEERALKARPTANVDAHQAYLRGRYFWNKRTHEGLETAGAYFRQAIAIDPNYAPAYAGLSDACQFSSVNTAWPNDLHAKARDAARKALELDPTLAEPHASLGLLAMNFDRDWATAEQEFRQAIALNPNYATAHHWYAEFLAAVGRADESLAEIRQAQELDPLSLIINTDIGKLLYYARRYDEAITQLQETLRMDPEFEQGQLWLGSVYATTGRYSEAMDALNRAGDRTNSLGWTSYVYGISGQRDEAEKAMRELQQIAATRPINPHLLLCAYLGLGEKDQAFAALEKEFEEHSVGLTSLKVNPWYDSLRDDPRFADLLRRLKLSP